jgi:hypothetical protein
MSGDRVCPPSLVVYDIGDGTTAEDILRAFDADTQKTIFNVVVLARESVPHAYINFFTVMHAEAALARYPVLTLGHVRVEPTFSLKDGDTFLKVQNIAKSVTKESLHALFAQFGMLTDFAYTQRGQARVIYESHISAHRAMRALHGTMVGGQMITVCQYVVPPDKMDFLISSAPQLRPVAPAPVKLKSAAPSAAGGARAAADSDEDEVASFKKDEKKAWVVDQKRPDIVNDFDLQATCAELMRLPKGQHRETYIDTLEIAAEKRHELFKLQITQLRLLLVAKEAEEEESSRRQGDTLNPLCVICMTVPRNCVLMPCMHFIVCESCVDRIKQQRAEEGKKPTCPLCNGIFSSSLNGVRFG